MHKTRPTTPAFTLIEMILVIAIIGILVSITLPAIAASRETTRRVKCLANLRSFGQGIAIYLNESKGILPRVRPLHDPSGNLNDSSLLDLMSSYLTVDPPEREDPSNPNSMYGRVADVFKCPSDVIGKDVRTNLEPAWRTNGVSYEYFAGAIMFGAEMATVPDPAKAVTLTYEMPQWKDLPVMVDNDDWHPLRKGGSQRNALFFTDWRSDWAGPLIKLDRDTPVVRDLICDVVRRNGGIPLPGCN
jgi:prepilin-type N-terminal cleavage/methylation domain-containing protein